MLLLRPTAAGLLTLLLATTLAGCATAQLGSQWKDPNFSAGSLKGKQVLVLCQAQDETLRRVCEDQWVDQLAVQGVGAVRSYSLPGFPPGGAATPDEIQAAARASGAVAVASMQLALSEFAVVNPGPQVGVGLGGGGGSGGYRGGGFSFGGFGVSFPLGGATATQSLGASTTLVDLASGALVWSGTAGAAAAADLSSQVSALTQLTIEAMRKAGVF